MNVIKGLLHLVDDFIEAVDDIFSFVDEGVNFGRFPSVFGDSWLDLFVHSHDALLHQGLLYIIQACDDLVVVLDDQLQGHHLSSIRVRLSEQFFSCFWH
jgi:hypothetical protein